MSMRSQNFFEFEGQSRSRLLSAGSLYVDVDGDLRDIAKDLSKDENLEDLQWSLRPLRAEFKTRDTEKLFEKYQARLQTRFFSVLLILNIGVNLIDTFWFFLNKVRFYFTFIFILFYHKLS